jgi:tRNA(Ile)-lysidine synthase
LTARVAGACRDLIPPQARVLVAVSGGMDSLSLLHLLADLAPGQGWTLAVAHFNHRQDPAIDELAVASLRDLATTLGLPFLTATADLPPGCAENPLRQARYAFLTAAARDWGASHVATGHHADDQAETLLLRLLRGAVAGLGGMPASRPLTQGDASIHLVRPLLTCQRQELVAYGQHHGLQPIADPSNDDRRFRRNHVRLTVLPLLESAWPGLRAILARTAKWLREDDELLQALAMAVVADLPTGDLPVAALQAQPGPIRRRVLRAVLAARGLPALASQDLATLEAVLAGERVATDLPGGWQARRHGGFLSLTPGTAAPLDRPTQPCHLTAGTGPVPGWPFRVTIRPATGDDAENGWQIRLPGPASAGNLVWRAAQAGDRLATDAGRLKVGEMLRQRGISPAERSRQLVLADDTGILWVVGGRRSNRLVASAPGEPAWLVQVTDLERPDH